LSQENDFFPCLLFLSLRKDYVCSHFLQLHILIKSLILLTLKFWKLENATNISTCYSTRPLMYKILKLVSHYWEFAIDDLKRTHCVFLGLEGLKVYILAIFFLYLKFKIYINLKKPYKNCQNVAKCVIISFTHSMYYP